MKFTPVSKVSNSLFNSHKVKGELELEYLSDAVLSMKTSSTKLSCEGL
jgi:hypothetical protein